MVAIKSLLGAELDTLYPSFHTQEASGQGWVSKKIILGDRKARERTVMILAGIQESEKKKEWGGGGMECVNEFLVREVWGYVIKGPTCIGVLSNHMGTIA